MSTIKLKGDWLLTRVGEGMDFSIQNTCDICGWVGAKHYAHNDYQHSNCAEERERHRDKFCLTPTPTTGDEKL